MRKKLRLTLWIVVPVFIWLALVIRMAPAHWAVWAANLPVQMEGITGTVWNGSVANVVVPYPGGAYALGSLSWDLNPWSLLTLSPCAEFETQLSTQRSSGTACRSIAGTLTLKDAQLSVPAAIAELWAPVRVRGQVDAQIENLRFSDNKIMDLQGSGSWTSANYHNSQTWINLGTIAFDLSEDSEGGVAARVFDIEGPLQLDLNSQFSLAGAYVIRGEILLRADAPQEIAQLLAIIAEQTQRGQYRVEWIGS